MAERMFRPGRSRAPPSCVAAKFSSTACFSGLQEYVVAWGWAPKSDLLRVDVLNTIGVSMMLMGIVCWLVTGAAQGSQHANPAPFRRQALILTAAGHSPADLAANPSSLDQLAIYLAALAARILRRWRSQHGHSAAGLLSHLSMDGIRVRGSGRGIPAAKPVGAERRSREHFSLSDWRAALLIEFARWLDRQPHQIYAVYDYWHTSPSFFLIRVGMLLVILTVTYCWCRWGAAQWGFSPVILLGQASLLVYWVHLEFVYGRVSILPKHRMGISGASTGLLAISLAMLALAYVRTIDERQRRGTDAVRCIARRLALEERLYWSQLPTRLV